MRWTLGLLAALGLSLGTVVHAGYGPETQPPDSEAEGQREQSVERRGEPVETPGERAEDNGEEVVADEMEPTTAQEQELAGSPDDRFYTGW